jgi:outer membrane protein OmpA-like peptidoglycan-associated protein
MSTMSGKCFGVLLSAMAIGAALSFGLAQARAGDENVTEDQILRALAPV